MSAVSQDLIALPDLPGIESGWEMLLPAEEQRKRFTGDLLAKNEERLQAVIHALAEGMAMRRIAKAFGISVNTVIAVNRRFGSEVETQKKEVGMKCLAAGRLAVERIVEEIDSLPKASLPIVAGVMLDKGQLLTGGATHRLESVKTNLHLHADINDWVESLPCAERVEAEGKEAQKAAATDGGSGAVVDGEFKVVKDGGVDSKSLNNER